MTILAQPLHTFKDGNSFVAAAIDNGQLVIAQTGNEEHAQEGKFGQLVTVINLQDAIAIAKAVLAAQEQAEEDAWIDELYQRHLDRQALVDSALEHDIQF